MDRDNLPIRLRHVAFLPSQEEGKKHAHIRYDPENWCFDFYLPFRSLDELADMYKKLLGSSSPAIQSRLNDLALGTPDHGGRPFGKSFISRAHPEFVGEAARILNESQKDRVFAPPVIIQLIPAKETTGTKSRVTDRQIDGTGWGGAKGELPLKTFFTISAINEYIDHIPGHPDIKSMFALAALAKEKPVYICGSPVITRGEKDGWGGKKLPFLAATFNLESCLIHIGELPDEMLAIIGADKRKRPRNKMPEGPEFDFEPIS